MEKVYLDNAATTQVRPNVIAKMQDALGKVYGNPSSTTVLAGLPRRP